LDSEYHFKKGDSLLQPQHKGVEHLSIYHDELVLCGSTRRLARVVTWWVVSHSETAILRYCYCWAFCRVFHNLWWYLVFEDLPWRVRDYRFNKNAAFCCTMCFCPPCDTSGIQNYNTLQWRTLLQFVLAFTLKFPLTLTYCNGCTYFKTYTLYSKRETNLTPSNIFPYFWQVSRWIQFRESIRLLHYAYSLWVLFKRQRMKLQIKWVNVFILFQAIFAWFCLEGIIYCWLRFLLVLKESIQADLMTLLPFTSILRSYKPSLTLCVVLLLQKKSFKGIFKVLTSFFHKERKIYN